MKKIESQKVVNVSGGYGCALTLLSCGLTFATIPTGLGAGLLLMGGASLCIAGIAGNCRAR